MSKLESYLGEDAPGGLLVLAANGSIVKAPAFFRRALFLDQREASSIYHLFDTEDAPYLSLNRIFRHPYGGTEYHLRVDGLFGTRHGFRYWPLQNLEEDHEEATFFIVDDSALMQTHDWNYRRLRREILKDVQDSLSSHFKNRLAAVQLLTETLRDAPQLAEESAPRLLQAVEELHNALNRVVTGIEDIQAPTDYEDSPVRLSDLATVINTWGTGKVSLRCTLKEVTPSTLIPASSIERIVLPIVENAIDASPRGSDVEVIIKEVDEAFAHFEIIDSGEGMSDRVKSRSQDPFFTTRSGHLGLGLAHAREALRDAGGQWEIESNTRLGTRVTVLLPVTTAAQLFR